MTKVGMLIPVFFWQTGFMLLKTGLKLVFGFTAWPLQKIKFQAQLNLVVYNFIVGMSAIFDCLIKF